MKNLLYYTEPCPTKPSKNLQKTFKKTIHNRHNVIYPRHENVSGLDMRSLQRPLDSKTQIRIVLEAEAVLGVIGLCESGEIELVSSEVLIFETIRNLKMVRREFGREVLTKAGTFIYLDDEIELRAEAFGEIGIKPLDALHLASAEIARADYFCTCDDQLLKKAKGIADLRTNVVTPVELIEEIE